MSLSRRKFMQAGVAAACVALPLKSALGRNELEGGAGSLLSAPQSPLSPKVDLEQLSQYTRSSFTPYVNTQFDVYLDPSNTRKLKLVEVRDYLASSSRAQAGESSPQTECFSLLFTIPSGRPFEQDTYLIEHGALGSFYLFLVPVSDQGKKGMDYYQAVIYRHPSYPGSDAISSKDAPPARNTQVQTGRVAEEAAIKPQPSNVLNIKTDKEVFYFRPLAIAPLAVPAKADPGAAGRWAASRLTLSQAPEISGLRLGMTMEEVLALFPGIKDDAEVRYSLSRPVSPFGVKSLFVKPGKYTTNKRFERVSQISFTFLDGRVSILNIGYGSYAWGHVDEFVAKFSEETGLPGADSWDAYVGLDTRLKTLTCRDFEVSVFAGGGDVDVNYVRMRDLIAQQKLRERSARARRTQGINP